MKRAAWIGNLPGVVYKDQLGQITKAEVLVTGRKTFVPLRKLPRPEMVREMKPATLEVGR